MNHHTQETLCPLCEEKLEQCEPFWRYVFQVIKSAFPDCHISTGWRGEVDQNELFKLKKTNARWPNSAHNEMKLGKPYSRALDLFRINDLGKAEFKREYYFEIAKYLHRLGMGGDVDWSGDWVRFKESNHFELRKV